MGHLVEILNSYNKSGIPPSQIYPQGQCESLDALYKLEDDWTDIIDTKGSKISLVVRNTSRASPARRYFRFNRTAATTTDRPLGADQDGSGVHQDTEGRHRRKHGWSWCAQNSCATCSLVCFQLFLACLKNLQAGNLLKEIDTDKLFSNITEILDTNVLFWRNNLFPLVRDMRKYRQPACIENMLNGFVRMKETFHAYSRYCSEQARCQHYCRENHAHNELFTAYLAWCETQKDCNR